MRRLHPGLVFVFVLALPCATWAQDAEEEEAPVETAAEDQPGYEPDQRGVEGDSGSEGGSGGEATGDPEEQSTGGGDQYEPDQRGFDGGDSEGGGEGGGDEAVEPTPPPAEPGFAMSISEDAEYEAAAGGWGGGNEFGFGFQLWLGAGLTGLDAIDGDNLVLPTQQGSVGGSIGLMLGARIGPLTIGPRLTYNIEPSFVLGTVGIDAQVALASGQFVPVVRVSVAYAYMLGLSEPLPSQNTPSGIWTELGVGLRVGIGGPFIVGGDLAGGWLAMFRDEVPACEAPCADMGSFDLRRPGSANGLTLRVHIFGGVSF